MPSKVSDISKCGGIKHLPICIYPLSSKNYLVYSSNILVLDIICYNSFGGIILLKYINISATVN